MTKPAALSIIERRRIEAELIKEFYATLVERFGKDEAQAVVAASIRRSAIAQAAQFAAAAGPDGTSLQSFIDIQSHWTAENALEIEVAERGESTYAFNVVRCRYAEMYKAMGLGEIGHLLSCNRDGAFCDGYDAKLKLTRTQTIMQGASHCDFHYEYHGDDAAGSGSAAGTSSAG